MRYANALMLAGLALLGGCDEEGQTTLVLETSKSIDVAEGTRVRWTLYGADINVADALGSVIAEGSESLESFPAVLDLQLPPDPHRRIDQGLGAPSKKDASFWFHVVVDLDGDGRICPGDLYEDFEGRDQQFFDEEPPRTATVPLVVIPEDWPCDG